MEQAKPKIGEIWKDCPAEKRVPGTYYRLAEGTDYAPPELTEGGKRYRTALVYEIQEGEDGERKALPAVLAYRLLP